MPTLHLYQQLNRKNCNKENVAGRVVKNPDLVTDLFWGLDHPKANIKYGCAKVMRILSEQNPEILYPHLDFIIWLLDSNNNIFKWDSIYIIGNLAVVDKDNRIDKILNKYLYPIAGPVMITAANTVLGAAQIAMAKPYLSGKIVSTILKTEKGIYQTTECRNVVLGHAIFALDLCWDCIQDKKIVMEFVKRQLNNTRNSTCKKAQLFLNKREK